MAGSSPVQPWGSPVIRSVLPVPCLPSDVGGAGGGLFLRCDVLVPRTRCSQIVAGATEPRRRSVGAMEHVKGNVASWKLRWLRGWSKELFPGSFPHELTV